MAYTIISQNNTTTTLSDENGNVITVPARVTLATSTDYTIKKVNNNSVDLESGDGKIIRGVPACVVLAGEGGGGGGGDQHNLGYYATQAALEEAHPTAEAGDWAIVGATDTVWIWDTDNSAWVDSDQKGQVTSVNGQTGDVSLSIPDAVQYSTMPTASADNLGDIVQFTGTTDANYTNGYFYKCVSDGQDPATYSWSQVSVQPAPSGLPDQTGQSGKFLTTDGTDASWGAAVENWAKGASSFVIGYNKNYVYENATGTNNNTIINGHAAASVTYAVAVGGGSEANRANCVVIGRSAVCNGRYGIAIGNQAGVGMNKDYAIQLGYNQTNGDANTFKVANANGNFEIMSADGTIPEARLADTTNAAQGQVLTLDSNLNAVWQAGGGGGSSLPMADVNSSSTAPSATSLSDGAAIAIGGGASAKSGDSSAPVMVIGNNSSFATISPFMFYGGCVVGMESQASGSVDGDTIFGNKCLSASNFNTIVGYGLTAANQGGVIIGCDPSGSASATGGFDVVLYDDVASQSNLFTVLTRAGLMPAGRLASTTGLADGNYRLRCTITNGVPTLSWVAE